jgi:hypothetical protein
MLIKMLIETARRNARWLRRFVRLPEQSEMPDNPEKDYADLFRMNDEQLVDEFDRLTDFGNPSRERNVNRMNRCYSFLASHYIAQIKRKREQARQPNDES